MYKVLSSFEETGRARRGYFVDGLGAAQFGTGATVDRLRQFTRADDAIPELAALCLAATDPANPYGAALGWPTTEGHRPGRKAGAIVVLVDGELVAYLERGRQERPHLQRRGDGPRGGGDRCWHRRFRPAAAVFASSEWMASSRSARRSGSPSQTAGFATTPQGLRLRA